MCQQNTLTAYCHSLAFFRVILINVNTAHKMFRLHDSGEYDASVIARDLLNGKTSNRFGPCCCLPCCPRGLLSVAGSSV